MATSHPPTNLCLALGSSSNSICSNHNSARTAITAHRTANFASKKFPLMLLRLRLCSVPSWDLCLPLALYLSLSIASLPTQAVASFSLSVPCNFVKMSH